MAMAPDATFKFMLLRITENCSYAWQKKNRTRSAYRSSHKRMQKCPRLSFRRRYISSLNVPRNIFLEDYILHLSSVIL